MDETGVFRIPGKNSKTRGVYIFYNIILRMFKLIQSFTDKLIFEYILTKLNVYFCLSNYGLPFSNLNFPWNSVLLSYIFTHCMQFYLFLLRHTVFDHKGYRK